MTTSTCDKDSTAHPPRSAARKNLRFALHYVEMVLAMLVGMFALAPLWSLAWPGLSDLPAVDALVMATNMTVGMAAWMRVRRHSWPRIAEMSAAMYLPFLVLLVPYAFGAVSAHGLMMGGHVLMMPAMLAAMLWRLDEYRH
jgi:flagellar biosynthetic protein FliP